MGIITEISVCKRNKKRVNVYVDGDFAVALEAITAVENCLKKGARIDFARLQEIGRESDKEMAFKRATEYLSKYNRTEKELREYLFSKEYSAEAVDSALLKLKEYGYLDDNELARSHVGTYSSRRGKLRMKQDLIRRGVDREYVEALMEELGSQSDSAFAVAEKYLRTRSFDERKLSAYLLSKGFEWEDISTAVHSIKKESE
ncbi:MAG: RecX family transcriptional regulator [Clostridia bacterium]|nr:RecX family transcriptional regulator [Clostridia bacterium]